MNVRTAQLPRISLVTCSFQQAHFLEAAMRSVLEQDYPDLEYIVIDGGSSDGSVDIIRKYCDRLAFWVSEADAGQTHALIKGFSRASGEIMGWLCSDDLLLPDALHTVGRFFRDHAHAQAAYGDALWIDQHGALIRPKREMRFSRFVLHYDHNYIPQPSMFWKRSLYRRVGGLDQSLHLTMDGDLWSRFSAVSAIRHLPHYLSCMRFYAAQKTRSLRAEGVREDDALRRRFAQETRLEHLPQTPLRFLARSARVLRKALAGGYSASVPPDVLAALERYRLTTGSAAP